jgi:hypothetical protein
MAYFSTKPVKFSTKSATRLVSTTVVLNLPLLLKLSHVIARATMLIRKRVEK